MRHGKTVGDAFDPCAESPATRKFVEALVDRSPNFRPLIHVSDEMFEYNCSSLRGCRPCAAILYYAKGFQIVQTMRNAASWRFGGLGKINSLLDFASGHGRVTRFLLEELDPKRICISEVHSDAVAFQQEYFGVEGLLTSTDPSEFACVKHFALIAATSFFSHLPAPSFRAWMAILLRCLEPGGLLFFSTLGSELLSDTRDQSLGIVFLPESETDRLDRNVYGTAYVTESFVREAIRQAGADWIVARFPRGLCGLQDLYLVADKNAPNPASFIPTYYPWGDVDRYELGANETLTVAGWLRTHREAPAAKEVQFRVNHNALAITEPEPVGPGAFRWSFEASSRRIEPDDVLMITAAAEDGLENIVALGTFRTHPPGRA